MLKLRTFYVDRKPYQTFQESLYCAEIKRIGNVSMPYQLHAERWIDFINSSCKKLYFADAQAVDLTGEYVHFFATPNASTFSG